MMKAFLVGLLLSAAAVSMLASSASGGATVVPTYKLSASLNAVQEVPHAKGAMSHASGHLTATLANGTLNWQLTFAHLTGRATAARLQVGVKGKTGTVVVTLCKPCKSGQHGTDRVPHPAAASLAKSNATYVNVTTAKNPAGEIRGELVSTSATATASAAVKVAVTLKDYSFTFSRSSAPAGSTVVFTVHNAGQTAHNMDIVGTGKRTAILPVGGNATLTVTFPKKGAYQVVCDVPRHIQLGMVSSFTAT